MAGIELHRRLVERRLTREICCRQMTPLFPGNRRKAAELLPALGRPDTLVGGLDVQRPNGWRLARRPARSLDSRLLRQVRAQR